jgi:hypothetical protein
MGMWNWLGTVECPRSGMVSVVRIRWGHLDPLAGEHRVTLRCEGCAHEWELLSGDLGYPYSRWCHPELPPRQPLPRR